MGTDCAEVLYKSEIDPAEIMETINRVIPCDPVGLKLVFDDGYPIQQWDELLRTGEDEVFCQWCLYPWEPDQNHYFLIVARPIV